jgi:PEGA domain
MGRRENELQVAGNTSVWSNCLHRWRSHPSDRKTRGLPGYNRPHEMKTSVNTSALYLGLVSLALVHAPYARARAGQNPQTGEVRFTADTEDERDAGVWIDGKYVGYVNELKGDRKVMLAPGEHEVAIHAAGYKDLEKKITVRPGEAQTLAVVLEENSKAVFPGGNAVDVRLDIQPKRAAVFVDGGYMGHGGDLGGLFHSMLVSPGKHHIRVELNGYKPYEADVTAIENEKLRIKIVLEKGAEPPVQPAAAPPAVPPPQ